MMTAGQLAAASSPPRLSNSFRRNRFHYSTRVFCGRSPAVTPTTPVARSIVRLAAVGLLAALAAGLGGQALVRSRVGATDADAVRLAQRELGARFDRAA